MFCGRITLRLDIPCQPINWRDVPPPCSLSWEGGFTSSVTVDPPMMVPDRLRLHEMGKSFVHSFHSTSLYMWWLR